ncbi:hypothetical protein LVJ85_03935 [Neisseria sp. Dent CA1/247]|nr:IgG-binding virulence factor TspB family protein [Neisseria sp. Dent CA1/247]UOO78204.1 hypothetical protein LVJ85_03935 [Neisseria sp. Dent CA1/247]
MGKFQHLFITGVILLGFSNETVAKIIEKSSDHLLVQNSGGKVIYQDITRIDGKEFRSVNWAKTEEAEARYLAKKINEVRVKHAPTAAMSSARVPAAIVGSVSRQTVLKNLLTKAVAGGRIAAGLGSGPVGWALTAAATYELVAPLLKGHDYVWDNEIGNFVTTADYIIEVKSNVDGENGKPVAVYRIGLSRRSFEYGYQSYKSTLDALCAKVAKAGDDYLIKKGHESHKTLKDLGSDQNGGCNAITHWGESSRGGWQVIPNKKQPITQSEFDDIVGPSADKNPTLYVNATAKDDGTVPGVTVSPNVTVPDGTVVTIGPYTDSDGQPKQVTVTFTTKNGETTVSVNTTPRPDLSPNSPSAPSASPNTGGQSSPSGSPDSSGQTAPQTSGQTGSQTGSQTGAQTDGQTNSQSNPKTDAEPDKKEEEKPKDGGLLCNIFPNILACAEMGEVKEDDPFQIPHITDETAFKPDFFLPDNGQCPAPQSVSVMGRQYSFSYDWLCRFAEMIRFLIIGIAGVSAAYIMFSGLKKD